jgi:hypothetical protein
MIAQRSFGQGAAELPIVCSLSGKSANLGFAAGDSGMLRRLH